METKLILWKLALLAFMGFKLIHTAVPHLAWAIFAMLIYLCINTTVYIVKSARWKKFFLLLSILQVILTCYQVDSLFLLLLPLGLCELTAISLKNNIVPLILVLIPMIWSPQETAGLYVLIAILSYFFHTTASQFALRLNDQESQLDSLRRDVSRLSRSLNDNKEFIKQSEYTYKLEERNRLAQVFHDKIGHTMTGALIQMEAAKHVLERDQEKAKELLQNAINISKTGIESIRLTLKNLKPPTEQMGISRLKLFIEEFSTRHGIHTPLLYKGNIDRITPIQWKIIQENVTEAMTNSLKYADATTISIEIHVLNTMIKVEVKDNGKGGQKIKKGLGIMGMEERTAAMNGKIIVDGANGFSVTMLLPIQA